MGFRAKGRGFFHLLAASSVTATLGAGHAWAAVEQQAPDAREFNLPEQALSTTLRAIGRISGREILFPADAVRGLRAPRIAGRLSATQAVRAALAGSGLVFSEDGDAILIRKPSPSPAAHEKSMPSDIIVTGSRIRGGPSASPAVASARENIYDAGINDLGSFARTLPQNYGGGQNPGVAGGGNQGGQQNLTASSTLNLRGLGSDATLTLINGHRLAYDGLAQGVDISAIPLAAIERLEIVTDGSSALYGSDAVGGVANIVLRRDFTGLTTSARIGGSTDGGNFEQQYDVVTGGRWRSGGMMATVDYSHNSGISARQRAYTAGLDDTATLVPRQKQISFLVTGHQEIARNVEFQVDGQFSNRRSESDFPALATGDVYTDGLVSRPDVTSFSITPSFALQLGGGWSASVSATHGESNTEIRSRSFSLGAETAATRLKYDNSLDVLEAGLEGPLARLPGGDLRVALGGGYRRVGLGVNVVQTSDGITATTADSTNARHIGYAYGEVALPLIGSENAAPLVHRLQIDGAVRYENYAGLGGVATPKVGIVYAPHPAITIKGTWGKSFKAATLNQQFEIREGVLAPGVIFTNYPPDRNVLYISGGTPDLQPERARTWSASLSFEPPFIPGLRVDASYFNIRFKNRVIVPFTSIVGVFADPSNYDAITLDPSSQALADVIAGLPRGVENLTGEPYDETTIGAIVDGSLRNAARQSVQGIDLAGTYHFSVPGGGTVELTGSASYLESDRQLNAAKPLVDLAGTIFDPPHWRARGGASYQSQNLTLSAFATYLGGVRDDRFKPAEPVGSFTSFDLIARLRSAAAGGLLRGVDASIAVLNLFNQKPARIRNPNPADPPYDSTNYPATGRVISLTVTKSW
ncbi:MAG: TonB-dependent receptor [Sphingobium sp.]|nr:TonB-dependent receptor [Sphingobium sp.]